MRLTEVAALLNVSIPVISKPFLIYYIIFLNCLLDIKIF